MRPWQAQAGALLVHLSGQGLRAAVAAAAEPTASVAHRLHQAAAHARGVLLPGAVPRGRAPVGRGVVLGLGLLVAGA